MRDLRSPNDRDLQAAIEAKPEEERTDVERRTLETLRSMANYQPTALGDR